MTVTEIPRALHVGEEDAPFVDLGNGVELQVLKVDVEAGLWLIRNRFQPGLVVERHKHTGCVHAFTLSGSWKYLEYPEVNRAGSYLFEPAGSVHTLIVPEDNTAVTDVWFAIQGANLNLDENDEIQMVIDAALIRDVYLGACEAAGLPRPPVIGA